ncbi:MAG: Bd3614 family nucleic acid deaminase [Pseudomonadota bacterium]
MEFLNHHKTQAAWVTGEGSLVVFARGASAPENPLDSAVTRLIFGINTEFGEERYRLLRRRIFTDGPLSNWDHNLIKVCAKRVSTGGDFRSATPDGIRVIDVGHDIKQDATSIRATDHVGKQFSPDGALSLVRQLAEAGDLANSMAKTHLKPRGGASALVGIDGILLGAAVNTNHTCQPRHAEVNLFLNLIRASIQQIPAGSTLYTSLKPCRMCASLILALAPSRDVKIIAGCDDPGTFGRHNLLDGILTIA